MALLEKLERMKNSIRSSPHKPIKGEYFVFENNGVKFYKLTLMEAMEGRYLGKLERFNFEIVYSRRI